MTWPKGQAEGAITNLGRELGGEISSPSIIEGSCREGTQPHCFSLCQFPAGSPPVTSPTGQEVREQAGAEI